MASAAFPSPLGVNNRSAFRWNSNGTVHRGQVRRGCKAQTTTRIRFDGIPGASGGFQGAQTFRVERAERGQTVWSARGVKCVTKAVNEIGAQRIIATTPNVRRLSTCRPSLPTHLPRPVGMHRGQCLFWDEIAKGFRLASPAINPPEEEEKGGKDGSARAAAPRFTLLLMHPFFLYGFSTGNSAYDCTVEIGPHPGPSRDIQKDGRSGDYGGDLVVRGKRAQQKTAAPNWVDLIC
ncbi:hypothetical protein FA13DRAFT_1718477 [Coprinellus micaceus]|uniref:Uncharacterized protein n=1 Tax=Coprinellus micaceus TaxID=71717 RepID=A0A4Y7SDE2_COPMI|nr:hypothetical protein FA13DRAFT_1718477 [Coprinellus micaceus]